MSRSLKYLTGYDPIIFQSFLTFNLNEVKDAVINNPDERDDNAKKRLRCDLIEIIANITKDFDEIHIKAVADQVNIVRFVIEQFKLIDHLTMKLCIRILGNLFVVKDELAPQLIEYGLLDILKNVFTVGTKQEK